MPAPDETQAPAPAGGLRPFPLLSPGDRVPVGLREEIRRHKADLLDRLSYKARDKRLIVECRKKAAELQAWLTAHCDEHMNTEPVGMPEWISALAEFDIVERGQLSGRFSLRKLLHDNGQCPDDAPVVCSACEGRDG